MSRSALQPRPLVPVLIVLGLAACAEAPDPISPEAAALAHVGHEPAFVSAPPADYQQQLAALRRATAAFHSVDGAWEAGWTLQFTPCIVNPTGTAAMGFHYVNPDLVDGTLNVVEPEALLYEPTSSGRLRLVAVEYVIPFSVHPSTAEPPRLFGLPFAPSMAFGVWGLHAWVWKHNPDGMHAPFNPTVSCDDA